MNVDGKQLLSEAAYLYGVMLILLDERIEGAVRERLLISYLRYKGQSEIPLIDEVCKLCQITGYSPPPTLGAPPARRPANYPENYFARHPLPKNFVEMVIGRLRSDDVYNQILSYPLPEHRSSALATQAFMLYVVLYFAPHVLSDQQAVMREIVDKHFSDNWILSYYLGFTIDLSIVWQPYKAATLALGNTLELGLIKSTTTRYVAKMDKLLAETNNFLQEVRNLPFPFINLVVSPPLQFFCPFHLLYLDLGCFSERLHSR
jgi:WASH complex subunit strumpellin